MTERPDALSTGRQQVFRLVERLPGGGQLVEEFHAPDRGQAVRRIRSIPAAGDIELWEGARLIWRSGADGTAYACAQAAPTQPEPRSFEPPC